MKFFILQFIFSLPITLLAQKKEGYYDYNWKPSPQQNARYYSLLEKTDSGWFRKDYYMSSQTLQMQALF